MPRALIAEAVERHRVSSPGAAARAASRRSCASTGFETRTATNWSLGSQQQQEYRHDANRRFRKSSNASEAAFAAFWLLSSDRYSALPALAAGSNMPWEAPLQSILDSIRSGRRIIAVIIIIVTGLTLAFGDTSGGFRKLIQIVFGLSIAFAASSFFLTFFSFAGGAVVA